MSDDPLVHDENGAAEVKEEVKEEVIPSELPPPPPIRRNRWGPSMLKEVDEGAEKKTRKRKSRWEAEDTSTAIVVSDGSKALVSVYISNMLTTWHATYWPRRRYQSRSCRFHAERLSWQLCRFHRLLFLEAALPPRDPCKR